MGQESLNRDPILRDSIASFEVNHDPDCLLLARSGLVDSLVIRASDELLLRQFPGRCALVAVGGYGRRELFPHSDVDLLVLVEKESEVLRIKESLSELLKELWDSGLQISNSLRTPAECARFDERNVELHISLLDARLLAGDETLFQALQKTVSTVYAQHAPRITRLLAGLARQRHAKFNNTPYHLEPNVKESPGGIRDLHLLRWLAQLQPEQLLLRESLDQLDSDRRDAQEGHPGESARCFLFALRCFLHIRNRRDNNLLTFELQDEASQALPARPVPPEEWMRVYFQHARRIFQYSLRALESTQPRKSSLIASFRERRNEISTPEFFISRDRVFLRRAAETVQSPEAILRLFSLTGSNGLQLSWESQRTLQQELPRIAQAFREHPPSWASWLNIFSQRHAAVALGELQETGILAEAIPVWQKIDSLVVRDFYHRYTVDEHTLVAIQAIDHLLQPQDEPLRRFHQLAMEDDSLGVLRFALLLHDIGKGITPGDHVNGSLEAARQLMICLSAPEDVRTSVLFLIEHHLDLSLIMNARDLEDPATARFLTSRIETQEDLRRLTLFTFADISAVNSTSMTPWRTEQLWRVYTLGVEQLTRELASDRIHDIPLFTTGSTASPALVAFLDGFPKRYLRTHTRQQIEHHLVLAEQSRSEGISVEIQREAGAYLMTVVTHDRPGLFASLCGVLASFGFNIVKGEASSNAAGYVLDLIRFTDPLRTLELNPEETERVVDTVKDVVSGRRQVTELLKGRRSIRRPIEEVSIVPSLRFDNHASENATLIDFVGKDRPGLLYDLTAAITASGCNIEVVVIDTEAYKALDVFYITRQGAKLNSAEIQQLQTLLLDATSREK